MSDLYERPDSLGDMLKPSEREVLSRWDEGDSIERIALTTRFDRDYVSSIVSRFSWSAEDRAWRKKAAHGSTALASAIAKTGKSYA